MQHELTELIEQNWMKLVMVLVFVAGQYYLFQYKLVELDNKIDDRIAVMQKASDVNSIDIKGNTKDIQDIQIHRASDMGEIRALLGGLQIQINKLEKLAERQTDQVDELLKRK